MQKHVAGVGAGESVLASPPLLYWVASIAITGIITAATTGLAMRTMGIGPITATDTTDRGMPSLATVMGAPVGVIITGTVIVIDGGEWRRHCVQSAAKVCGTGCVFTA